MSVPMGVTFGSLGVLGPRAAFDVAARARELGYRSFWTVEATGTDAVSLLGAVAAMREQSARVLRRRRDRCRGRTVPSTKWTGATSRCRRA